MNINSIITSFLLILSLSTGVTNSELPPSFNEELSNTLNTKLTSNVPILMYHHISEDVTNDATISPELFEEHIQTLLENGYTPILLDDLINFVYTPSTLPEKPVCITFDDGYTSNYEYAFPILKKYNVKATISIIGNSINKDTYKNTSEKMYPHFSIEQAIEMESSGLIQIENHTYDMHQNQDLESGEHVRTNATKLPNETNEQYILALTNDIETMKKIFNQHLKKDIDIFTYPHGIHDELSEKTLKELGVKLTLTTTAGNNLIQKGNKQSLYKLKRYNISEEITSKELLTLASP